MSVFFPDEVGGGSKKGKNVEDAEADGWGFLGEVATHKSKEEKNELADSFTILAEDQRRDSSPQVEQVEEVPASPDEPTASEAENLRLGYLHRVLDLSEGVMTGLSSWATSFSSTATSSDPVSTPTPPTPALPSEPSCSVTKLAQLADNPKSFLVICTNWYYRRLYRLFRFFPDSFQRVHPNSGKVRGVHLYTSVKKITVVDQCNIVIYFGSDSMDEVIKGKEKEIEEMVAFILEGNPEVEVDHEGEEV